MIWQEAIEGLMTSNDPSLKRKLLAVLHEEINQGHIKEPAFAKQLNTCYQNASDPWLSTEIKRLLNRMRSRQVLGRDLLRLKEPPLGDQDRIKLWEDLNNLKSVYESSVDRKESFENKYDVCEMIGEGGMSVVFRAVRNSDNQEVAIKYLRKKFFHIPATVARFQRECRLCLSFDHPRIVKVYESGEHQGNAFLIMEYFHQGGLDNYINVPDLNGNNAISAILQIAGALEYIHSRDVIHRDVKLSNFLVAKWQPEAEGDPEDKVSIKLTDFGLSKELSGDGFTKEGARMGTELYSAPELLNDPAGVDHRADIYSLGVSLYRLVSGGAFPVGDYKPMHILQPSVSPELDDILRKCLLEDREERYSSVTLLTNELEKFK